MNRTLALLTFRVLLGRRRTALIGLVLLLPVGIAAIYRTADPADTGEPVRFAFDLGNQMLLTVLIPIVVLVMGTNALGSEVEDGTAVFVLTKPVERWRIMAVKTLVAALAGVCLVVPATIVTAWVIMGSVTAGGVALGLGLSAAVITALYSTVFVALSAWTHRALIVGLCYVFVWEAFATNLFASLRWLSIREYSQGWARLFVDLDPSLLRRDTDRPAELLDSIFDPSMSLGAAVGGSGAIIAVAFALGVKALRRYQIGEVA